MKDGRFFTAIILSAGSSQRMGYNKMLLEIGSKSVFERTVEVFENCEAIDEIIIAAPKEMIEKYGEIIKKNGYAKITNIVSGGATRQESVRNALAKISEECEYIAVHDGARPLIKAESIAEVARAAIAFGGAVASVLSVDTLKSIDENGMITATVDREATVQVRTPQIFKKEILLAAHEAAKRDGFEGTDECMLVERCSYPIKTVITGRDNVKLTYPEDVLYMTEVLRSRGAL
ncbi:MAG: 2-C-methyl-D-erythritol 4-phosphate cytidylyltransferase [Clostridia bacterium]|nr:2-C-methyl-D-erythritol 4-phosphate cytidylyltransferase [Clostridia bacterium]